MITRRRLSPESRRKLARKFARKPQRMHFTEKNVLTLKVNKQKPDRYWDEGTGSARGLYILIQPTGTASYRVHLKGFPDLTLGRVGEMTLEEAREKARGKRRAAAHGEDPRKVDLHKLWTLDQMIDRWMQSQIKKYPSREKTAKDLRTAFAEMLDRPIVAITYDDIEKLIVAKRDERPKDFDKEVEYEDEDERRDRTKGKLSMANLLHRSIRAVFRYSTQSGVLAKNPIEFMPQPAPPQVRKRKWFVREAAEQLIRDLWRVAGEFGGDDERFIKMLLITGKRRAVVQKMQWDDISGTWLWTPPPGANTKRNSAIPLPPEALKVLGKHQGTGRVFPPINETALVKQVRERIVTKRFYWHGLRNVVITKMAELRIPPWLVDMITDHRNKDSGRGTGATYDNHDYRAEMLDALIKWTNYIKKVSK